jgi:hypothetical protein
MKLRVIIPIHKTEDYSDVRDILDYNKGLSIYNWREITFHKIKGDFTNRADAMNHGYNTYCETDDYVMFLHCDTKLPSEYARLLYEFFIMRDNIPFCFFRLSFDTTETLVSPKIIEQFVNNTRKEPYGDQCFTMSGTFFRENGMFPSTLLLEDVIFYRAIQKTYELVYDNHVMNANAITSDRRFRYKGTYISEITFLRNVLNNRSIILLYKMGVSPDILGIWYYKNNLYGSLNG